MGKLTVSIQNADALSKEMSEEIEKVIHEIATEIFNDSQMNLIEPDEKGRIISDRGAGGLLGSGKIDYYAMGASIQYDAEHADYVEYGTRPHMMPIRPLQRWAKRKLGLSEKESWSAAYAIRGKIAKEGTAPRHFLRDAVDSVKVKYGEQGITINASQISKKQ